MIEGIIFDFNGTLYQDKDLNDYAWSKMFDSVADEKHKGKYLQFCEGKENLVNDYTRSEAILKIFNKKVNDEAINKFSDDKENLYQEEARKQNRKNFTEGFEDLMEYLVKNKIPFSIASMAPLTNMKFYLNYLHLDRWFSLDKNIIYDNNIYKEKNPMYLDAAKSMNIKIENCLLVEDTPYVIEKSFEVGVKNVIYLNSNKIKFNNINITQEISNFTELNYNIFK